MKNLKQLVLVFLVALVFSCEQEGKLESPTFDYEQIGINHNKALDYMFESLKR